VRVGPWLAPSTGGHAFSARGVRPEDQVATQSLSYRERFLLARSGVNIHATQALMKRAAVR